MGAPSIHIDSDRRRLMDFCRKWGIVRLAFFGSVLRDDFRPDSDVDVMVSYAPDIDWFSYDYLARKEEIESLFGRPVDIIEEGRIRNPVKQRCIHENLEVVYESEWSGFLGNTRDCKDKRVENIKRDKSGAKGGTEVVIIRWHIIMLKLITKAETWTSR